MYVHRDRAEPSLAARILLRESYRDEQGKAQKRTLANLSKLPGDVIDGLKALLKGGTVIDTGPDDMQIQRSLRTAMLQPRSARCAGSRSTG